MALGIVDRRWTLEDVVEMTAAYNSKKEAEAFEAAFKKFQPRPKAMRSYTPTPKDKIPLLWYLNPNSDGPEEKGLTD